MPSRHPILGRVRQHPARAHRRIAASDSRESSSRDGARSARDEGRRLELRQSRFTHGRDVARRRARGAHQEARRGALPHASPSLRR